jgi:hypothetical protein
MLPSMTSHTNRVTSKCVQNVKSGNKLFQINLNKIVILNTNWYIVMENILHYLKTDSEINFAYACFCKAFVSVQESDIYFEIYVYRNTCVGFYLSCVKSCTVFIVQFKFQNFVSRTKVFSYVNYLHSGFLWTQQETTIDLKDGNFAKWRRWAVSCPAIRSGSTYSSRYQLKPIYHPSCLALCCVER